MVVGKRLNREQREARGDRRVIRGEGRERDYWKGRGDRRETRMRREGRYERKDWERREERDDRRLVFPT
jgi:hypothetical protein